MKIDLGSFVIGLLTGTSLLSAALAGFICYEAECKHRDGSSFRELYEDNEPIDKDGD